MVRPLNYEMDYNLLFQNNELTVGTVFVAVLSFYF